MGIIYHISGHQFQAVQHCSDKHILSAVWQIGNSSIAFISTMCQWVVVGDTCHNLGIAAWLIGIKVRVEVTGVVIVNLIVCLRLV